jgi:dCMP deaminase
MQFAKHAATRSTCLTAQVGAVIVRDRQVLATGYNGPPSGIPHCTEQGFCYPGLTQCGKGLGLPSIAIHAEINAIAQAAKAGIAIDGASIYVTHEACLPCLKAIIAAGIREVICGSPLAASEKEDYVKDLFLSYGLLILREWE